MKAIVLAGGFGTRLHPLTKVASKQLLPIYNKPMLYYPVSSLIAAGIKDIAIITMTKDKKFYEALFGDGSELGIKISYLIQDYPNGIAESFIIAEDFIQDSPCCLILGDNIFFGENVESSMKDIVKNENNHNQAHVFAYHVGDPERYGVVKFDGNKVVQIVEKPKEYISSYAVTGLYFYPKGVSAKAKSLAKSDRGELEITDLNQLYLNENNLSVKILNSGCAWLDTGTHDSMLNASIFVKTLEERQNLLVGSIEYEAYKSGFININQYKDIAKKHSSSEYGKKLLAVLY
jgi:glucose-1-phosphate thymidylyltransferase